MAEINTDIARLLLDYIDSRDLINPRNQLLENEILERLANLLRIACIQFIEFETPVAEFHEKPSAKTDLVSLGIPGADFIQIRHMMPTGRIFIFRIYIKDGDSWSEEDRSYVHNLISCVAIKQEHFRLSKKLDYIFYHDSQMSLPNLPYGLRTLGMLAQRGLAGDYAVIFMNIHNMAEINSNYTFPVGTVIMEKYIRELGSILHEPEAVWRIGGDNFGALVLKEHLDDFLLMVKGVNISLDPSKNDAARISASAGVCLMDSKTQDIHSFFGSAQSALFVARYVKRIPYAFFDAELEKILNHTKTVETQFQEALANDEFIVYYQPKVSIQDYRLEGAESLCRWVHNGDLIPPDSFIPILENSKRICDLDFYMLSHVCADLRKWIDEGLDVVRVSVNFSKKHLSNPNFVKDILEIIDSYEVPHNLIVAEFTETSTDSDMIRIKDVVYTLKMNKIETSVDDFGIGYSSMSLIRDIPFNELKIDKSFLQTDADNYDRKVVTMKHVIALATDLGMSCIVEGVETESQIELLRSLSCYRVQGYYFDRPLKKEDFHNRLCNPVYSEQRNSF